MSSTFLFLSKIMGACSETQISLGKGLALVDQEAWGFVHQTYNAFSKLQEYIPNNFFLCWNTRVWDEGILRANLTSLVVYSSSWRTPVRWWFVWNKQGKSTLEEDSESLRSTLALPFHVVPTVPLFNAVLWFNSWLFCSLCFMLYIRTLLIPRREVICVDKHCQRPSSLHKSFSFYGIIVSSNKQHPKEVLKMKLLFLPVKP